MGSRTRIKVCGMTRKADALAAIDCGVDALGFIFVKKSPRYIAPESAREIIRELPPFINCVGVFMDEDPSAIREIVDLCGLFWVQLHGSETPEYCRRWRQSSSPARLIKAFRVGPDTCAADFRPYEEHVAAFLLDTYVKGRQGGTGKVFDWERIERFELQRPLILAGGLTPENAAAAARAVQPFALDVNSGVEEAPGRKDPCKLRTLVSAVCACDRERSENGEGNRG